MGTITTLVQAKAELRRAIKEYIRRSDLRTILGGLDPPHVFEEMVNPNESYENQLPELIEKADDEGWLLQLVEATLQARAKNRKFVEIVQPVADYLKTSPGPTGPDEFKSETGQPERKPEKPGEREPGLPRWGRWLALGLIPILAIVAAILFWPSPQPVEPVFAQSAPIELLAPVDAFNTWKSDRQSAGRLAPGAYTPYEATIDNETWYRVEKAQGQWVYLPKDSVQDWQNAGANLETIGEIQTLEEPKEGAAPARALQPGDLAFLPKGESLKRAEVGGKTWYAVPRRTSSSTVYTFFGAANNETKLVPWTAIDACLQVSKNTSASLRPLSDDGEGGHFDAGEVIRGEIQKASTPAQMLFRFRSPGKEPYYYIDANSVTQTPCELPTGYTILFHSEDNLAAAQARAGEADKKGFPGAVIFFKCGRYRPALLFASKDAATAKLSSVQDALNLGAYRRSLMERPDEKNWCPSPGRGLGYFTCANNDCD